MEGGGFRYGSRMRVRGQGGGRVEGKRDTGKENRHGGYLVLGSAFSVFPVSFSVFPVSVFSASGSEGHKVSSKARRWWRKGSVPCDSELYSSCMCGASITSMHTIIPSPKLACSVSLEMPE